MTHFTSLTMRLDDNKIDDERKGEKETKNP